jgi:hypothetical protein
MVYIVKTRRSLTQNTPRKYVILTDIYLFPRDMFYNRELISIEN